MLTLEKTEAALTESKSFPRAIFMAMFLKIEILAAASAFLMPGSSSFGNEMPVNHLRSCFKNTGEPKTECGN